MSRIIAGLAGSINLKSAAKATRPTSDRVKESLFSILESRNLVEDKEVLDLYAGTGALGLEAASRGASGVTLVERDREAISVVQANILAVQKSIGNNCVLRLVRRDVSRFLQSTEKRYDLIFMDPPYALGAKEVSQVISGIDSLLGSGGVLVVERAGRAPAITPPPFLLLDRVEKFGDTALYFLNDNRRTLSER